MNRCKKALLWLWMLTKRLYRKPSFLVVLALILLLSAGYGLADLEDSGVLTVALAGEGHDILAEEIMDSLASDGQLIRYVRCADPEAARQLLEAGKADVAWIFPTDLQARMEAFGRNPTDANAFITVLERQTDVTTRLTREALSEAFYAGTSRVYYLDFVRKNAPVLDSVSDEQLLAYYNSIAGPESLFMFTDLTGQTTTDGDSRHFLLWPVRGLLAVVVLLCALACSMYYMQDWRRGTFNWVSEKRQALAELGCQMAGVLQVAVIASVALAFLGLTGGVLRETVTVLLYSLCCGLFAMVMRRICGSIGAMGVMLPLLILASLLICPVFLDLGMLRSLQFLLPPTYFINGVADGKYLAYMAIYSLCLWTLYWVLGKLHRK